MRRPPFQLRLSTLFAVIAGLAVVFAVLQYLPPVTVGFAGIVVAALATHFVLWVIEQLLPPDA